MIGTKGPAVVRTKYYQKWYDPSIKMKQEDWIYIGLLLLACIGGFDLGLLIGWIWTRTI